MNNLMKINDIWNKLSDDEKDEFINSKFTHDKNLNITLESITGTEKFTMNFGGVNVCSKCGKSS